jgi:hypothetical protein
MSNKPNANPQQPDPSTLAIPPQTRPDITHNFETVAGKLAGIAERSGGWVKEQIHSGLQDFVGRFIYGETKTPEPEKDKQRDIDRGIDR